MVFRALVSTQVRFSQAVERMLASAYRLDGHADYRENVVPQHLRPGMSIYDVGGGKRPYLTEDKKRALNAYVVGVDIDQDELALAPEGTYDRTATADIAKYVGDGDADLIICQAVFEHVQDVNDATRALASILKPGGIALLFVPCRNALFARLNLLLPERAKRSILFTIFPKMKGAHGFPSFYSECTPSGLSRLANQHSLEVVEVKSYWVSSYFYAFFPAYLVWRAWTIVAKSLGWRDCCESFTLVLRKPTDAGIHA